VNKIWEGIGKAAKANEVKVVNEINSVEDIFSGIEMNDASEDVDIFN
jgi:hypothetical protein